MNNNHNMTMINFTPDSGKCACLSSTILLMLGLFSKALFFIWIEFTKPNLTYLSLDTKELTSSEDWSKNKFWN